MESAEQETFEPGVYSAFVLYDDGTWMQPSFRIGKTVTREQIEYALQRPRGAFFVAGLEEDGDADPEHVQDLKIEG